MGISEVIKAALAPLNLILPYVKVQGPFALVMILAFCLGLCIGIDIGVYIAGERQGCGGDEDTETGDVSRCKGMSIKKIIYSNSCHSGRHSAHR